MRISLKYVAVSIAAQLIACASLWLAAILFSSDSLFNVIVYFYWPCIILVAAFLGTSGESAMIAVPIYGMALGMITYSVILAAIVGFLKKKRA
ncbi:MAG TPA: hypothetical protein VHE60_00885 [Pyrinomonadaceae bacterium]|nr:hypothetical protein [Pyrinomonadaceae bacterium]